MCIISRMSLTVTSLASGSNGNAFLVETGTQALLVDAGIAARTLEKHLRQRNVDPAALSAIVVSHEHHDHILSVERLARRYGIAVVCSQGTANAMGPAWQGLEIRALNTTGTTVGDVELWGFPLPHDATDPQGILLAHKQQKVGWAVDLGHAPEYLVEWLNDTDLVIVEANHDRELLLGSAYPWGLKNRILGPKGHLSNVQATELLLKLGDRDRTRSVWLAHLSENTNDHPRNVLKIVQNQLDMGQVKFRKIEIAERNRPSVTWGALQTSIFDLL